MVTEVYNRRQAALILIAGVIGILPVCGVLHVCGIVALLMGNRYLREAEAQGLRPDTSATTGRILGIVGTVMFAVQALMVIGICGGYALLVMVYVVVLAAAGLASI